MNNDRSISVKKVSRTFRDFVALKDVDLDVPSGQIFGFLGPNGAGKSTLVKILTTILAPTAGVATVAGFDVHTQSDKIRQHIGVALQDVGLDALMTARELLLLQAQLFRFSKSEAITKSERLLKKVKLETVDPKKRVGDYSGGMKRRLDLALALVHDPDILFLDEPTTGLDPASRADIWEEVHRINKEDGVTIFLTTQYLEEADKLAQEVAIINKGQIVARGTPSALKKEIGNEVITITLEDPNAATQASQKLKQSFSEQQISGHELSIYLTDAAARVPELVRLLDQEKIKLNGLTLSQPTLDDVFLHATGERMTEKTNTGE
ncbi:MAG: ATP-binding cassette domain-containing protein [Patescibacteria group bacterium]